MVKTKDIIKLSKDGTSIIVDDKRMEVGKEYSINYKGDNYAFRKTPEDKIEFYEVLVQPKISCDRKSKSCK